VLDLGWRPAKFSVFFILSNPFRSIIHYQPTIRHYITYVLVRSLLNKPDPKIVITTPKQIYTFRVK
jgi:hypothetical protein